jgi:hypothetical protein
VQAKPGQLVPVANASALRAVTYQHWTAAIRQVLALDADAGVVTFAKPPASYTGDGPSGSRFYLENAPEYLASGSGTFFADDGTIWYAPLAVELASFAGTGETGGVVAAKPQLLELVSQNNTHDVAIENVELSHTDVDYGACFASNCALQSASWLTTAAVHFGFSQRVSLTNVTIQHTGGFGLWFGPGVRNATFANGRVLDVGAGGVRIGEPTSVASDAQQALHVTITDSVIRDGGHVYRAGCGVLLQAAAESTVTHNDISVFRYTGVSVGWMWSYGPTSNGNNTISKNNISTIGMGELSDLGWCSRPNPSNRPHVFFSEATPSPPSAFHSSTSAFHSSTSAFHSSTADCTSDRDHG